MKCISLWQPWATLIAIGAKKIETRGWPTRFSGQLAIHAAKRDGMLSRQGELAAAEALKAAGYPIPLDLRSIPHGAIVAVCRLQKCVATQERNGWSESDGVAVLADGTNVDFPERYFGDYSPGRFAWFLSDVRKLEVPITFRGSQGFFDVPDELILKAIPAVQAEADSFHFA